MLKKIITICIAGAFGLLILSILWPFSAQTIATQVLKGVSDLQPNEVPFLGYDEPRIKIVDPETIPKVITNIPEAVKKDATLLSNIVLKRFNNKTSAEVTLTIEAIAAATNNERVKAGLPPLSVNGQLIESATIKTGDMIANQYFEHTSPAGVAVSDLGNKVGYNYIIMGENLALGNFESAEDLLSAWMNSPGHRANILNPLYKELGVYAMQGIYQGQSVWFAVQHFGTNRSVCPSINAAQKASIDQINKTLSVKKMEILALRYRIENREYSDGEAYQDMVNQFNKLVDEYNQLLTKSRQQIETYNKSVSSFNNCLSKYQASDND